ncbi:tryptophan synthase subunit alpha [Ornithinibacillus sp. L9]|uniref:Tryptophan synthase alpha chain n=1 Tax=Ornithinibacillus caprae TaxID=2678566 RepID=A0A6N8FFF6_9BACI|nr:tryptophan synthase subunit alpha [Ornithinibacillus caprae]MUK87931.1 tryptophan synthase subunit alpha [Ornithinibacillus caprae]
MSKQRLDAAFELVKTAGRKAFIPYLMAGDGGMESLEEKILFLQEAGVTAIELGIPFSDPVADGPTIQEAGKRALENGTTLRVVLDYLAEIKDKVEVPLILMTYLNPVYKYGIEKFTSDARTAGVSGIIVPDLPLEQSGILLGQLKENSLAFIQLVTLTSPKERIRKIAEASEGFLYAVTVNGITGERTNVGEDLDSYIKRIMMYSHTPVLAGFGVSTPEQVKEIGAICDGVIVGSKIISLWEAGRLDEIRELVRSAL